MWSQAIKDDRDYYLCDNGWFRPGKFSGYFRIAKSGFMHDGSGEGSLERFKSHGIEIKPWRKTGKHILICPPLNISSRVIYNESAYDWLESVVLELVKHTDRPIVIRPKAQWEKAKRPREPLVEDLKNCWALVCCNSTTAVEALLEGVPVFCTHPCVAQCMGLTDLSKIETPLFPDDRERWAGVLAANQWLLSEIQSGMAWNYLKNIARTTHRHFP